MNDSDADKMGDVIVKAGMKKLADVEQHVFPQSES